ncbi:hypothetical protein [Nocardioides plantarum]|uniref:Lipoprotein n=1 Tax=Nocardioides plantarum TaxID=29299 RepID=A0ABV5KB93_9ACTN|nr:hypothetical protein [Nocardioides plantarum]
MRRLLGALLLTVLTVMLAGCGEDAPPTASDPAPTTSSTSPSAPTTSDLPTMPDPDPDPDDPSEPPTKSPPLIPGGAPFELLEIVSGAAGRGGVSDQAVEITSTAQVDAFVAPFSDALADDVRSAVAAHPVAAGRTRYAAVVGLGCDVPPGVDVSRSGEGYAITGLKVADPKQECVVAVTSVALVAIDD